MDENSAETGKRAHELVSANGAPATGHEKGKLADSIDFHSDSHEQIEESIKRTGLRSRLDEAFRAATEMAKRSPHRKH